MRPRAARTVTRFARSRSADPRARVAAAFSLARGRLHRPVAATSRLAADAALLSHTDPVVRQWSATLLARYPDEPDRAEARRAHERPRPSGSKGRNSDARPHRQRRSRRLRHPAAYRPRPLRPRACRARARRARTDRSGRPRVVAAWRRATGGSGSLRASRWR